MRRLAKQLSIPVNFCGDFRHVTTPFAVSADKDTVKHVPKQVTGIKLADFSHPDPKMTELIKLPPFIQFLYLGHPTATEVDGRGLAKLIFSELEKSGVTTVTMKNCVGVCGDGQYLGNNVVNHLEEQHCLSGLFNVWDFGHMLELQWDSALLKCPDASDIVSAVNDVVRDLANSWYKAYAEECKVQNIRFLQPSALKRLKFVKHVEAQFTKFIKMFKAIHVVAQQKLVQLRPCRDDPEENDIVELSLSEGERRKKEERRAAKLEIRAKRVQLETINRRLDHADFLPQLAMVNNIIQLVSKFSLAGQHKLLTIGEYVNLVDLYKLALNKLDFRTFPTPTMLYHLKEFFKECEKGIPGYFAPDEGRTRSARRRDDVDRARVNTEDPEDRMIRIMVVGEELRAELLDQHAKYWWVGGPNSLYNRRPDDVRLILSAARLINFIAGPHVKLTPDVKGVNVPMFKCLTCSKYHTSKNHSTGKKCVGTKFEEVEELVPDFALSLPTDYDIADLQHLVIPPWRLQLTPSQINRVKDVFKEVCDEIRDHKVVPTLDVAARALLTCQRFWSRCQPGPLLLFLKCLVACASEAIIETYGSVMEKLFQRYTSYTTDDDARCQKEMFLKMTAPTVPLTPAWQSFIDESIKEYLKVHPGSTFAHEGKVVNRMPITSMTAQQLIRGDESNANRVAGIHSW